MTPPKVIKEQDGSLTLSINFTPFGSSLEQEEHLALALNQLGLSATSEILSSFDENDSSITVNELLYSSKGKKKKSTNVRSVK